MSLAEEPTPEGGHGFTPRRVALAAGALGVVTLLGLSAGVVPALTKGTDRVSLATVGYVTPASETDQLSLEEQARQDAIQKLARAMLKKSLADQAAALKEAAAAEPPRQPDVPPPPAVATTGAPASAALAQRVAEKAEPAPVAPVAQPEPPRETVAQQATPAPVAPPAAAPAPAPVQQQMAAVASPSPQVAAVTPAPAPQVVPQVAPPVAAVPTPPPTEQTANLDPQDMERLAGKAAEAIRNGDIASARLVLEHAVRAGDATALYALAETYDPRVLTKLKVQGMQGEPETARNLYQRALDKGVEEARARL